MKKQLLLATVFFTCPYQAHAAEPASYDLLFIIKEDGSREERTDRHGNTYLHGFLIEAIRQENSLKRECLAIGRFYAPLIQGRMCRTFFNHPSPKRRHFIVSKLLAHGASPTAQNAAGDTPLHLAAQLGDLHITRLLLAAIPNTTQDHGDTVFKRVKNSPSH